MVSKQNFKFDAMGYSVKKKPHQKIQIGSKKKIGFVCSGGGSKAGAFHLGVALALQEQGFKFFGGLNPSSGIALRPGPMEISTYVGSSAGSIIGTYLAAGYSLDNIFNSFLGRKPTDPRDAVPKILPRLTYQKLFKIRPGLAREQFSQILFLRNLVSKLMRGNWQALLQLDWIKTSGIFSTHGLENYLRKDILLSNRFQDFAADLFIVATQLNHSRKVVFGKYSYKPPPHDLTCQYNNDVPISEACAASTALPFLFAPFAIKGPNQRTYYYIDGEIRDTLSTHVARDAGADLIFASYTHQPYHFLKEIGSLTDHGLPSIIIQSIYLLIEQKIKGQLHHKHIHQNAIQSVSSYCKQNGISEEHRLKLCSILEAELHHRMHEDTIYIHPSPTDAHMFFGEHFSLSAKKLSDYVRSGFKAAIETLKHYEFADRKLEPRPIVSSLKAVGEED